ncbi:hypothetical protein GOP47_0024798 [Adiantum capillus-veneris]|uniref:Uncharacterized protein n=1 Tax=Adiantum capillus-veneris TaxID=13818 RepID=A0A9D4U3N4_ADICA|nr:hypothetical protein GOP47_0024798 [Adiantum capillus-veneris]
MEERKEAPQMGEQAQENVARSLHGLTHSGGAKAAKQTCAVAKGKEGGASQGDSKFPFEGSDLKGALPSSKVGVANSFDSANTVTLSRFHLTGIMEFWPEFLASSGGKEFVAGGLGGMAGVMAGHPLDTLRIHLQQPKTPGSVFSVVRQIYSRGGPLAFYKGMEAPLATVAIQNAVTFQAYAHFLRALSGGKEDPPSYGKAAIIFFNNNAICKGDWASHCGKINFKDRSSYEYTRELLHPGCRKSHQESPLTMLTAGGIAGVASWVSCYPLDVVKSRLQAQGVPGIPIKYKGIVDCFRKSVQEEGFRVLWRGLGTAVARAYIVNGAIFTVYEASLRSMPKENKNPAQLLGAYNKNSTS